MDRVDLRQQISVEIHFPRVEVLFQLRDGRGSDDRARHEPASVDVGERELRRWFCGGAGDRCVRCGVDAAVYFGT